MPILRNLFEYDTIAMPFFFNRSKDKRTLIVLINTASCTVDLFDRVRQTDSKLFLFLIIYLDHDISDIVLHMMDFASKLA